MDEPRLVIIAPPLTLHATARGGGVDESGDNLGESPAGREPGDGHMDGNRCAGAADVPAPDVERPDSVDGGVGGHGVGLYGGVNPVQRVVRGGDDGTDSGSGGDLVDERVGRNLDDHGR